MRVAGSADVTHRYGKKASFESSRDLFRSETVTSNADMVAGEAFMNFPPPCFLMKSDHRVTLCTQSDKKLDACAGCARAGTYSRSIACCEKRNWDSPSSLPKTFALITAADAKLVIPSAGMYSISCSLMRSHFSALAHLARITSFTSGWVAMTARQPWVGWLAGRSVSSNASAPRSSRASSTSMPRSRRPEEMKRVVYWAASACTTPEMTFHA